MRPAHQGDTAFRPAQALVFDQPVRLDARWAWLPFGVIHVRSSIFLPQAISPRHYAMGRRFRERYACRMWEEIQSMFRARPPLMRRETLCTRESLKPKLKRVWKMCEPCFRRSVAATDTWFRPMLTASRHKFRRCFVLNGLI